MSTKCSSRKLIRMMLISLLLVLSVTGAAFASSDLNTDSDTEPVDGTYTFTGNGDWYGYTSFLYLDNNEHSISGREYKVTLPQDGRLQIELSTADPSVFIDVHVLEEGNRILFSTPNCWAFGAINETISVKKNTEILEAGTYSVIFRYNNTRSELIQYDVWPPGYHEFYHNLTFVGLSTEEKDAFSVEKKIKALPESYDLSLSDESAVASVKTAFDSLTSSQKALLSSISVSKLNSCLDRIKTLREEKAAEEAASGDNSSNDDPSDTGNGNDSLVPGGDTPGSDTGSTDDVSGTDSDTSADGTSDEAPAKITNANGTFRVLSEDSGVAAFVKARNKASVTVPSSVIINGSSYRVTRIDAKAFTGSKIRTVTVGKNVRIISRNAFNKSKAKTVILKTKRLSKASVKGSLKGSKVKTVKVKITKKASKTNKKYVKKYKKYFTKANAGRKVVVK